MPHIADYILRHGDEPFYATLRQRFSGVGLGDVCPGEEHTLSLPDLAHGLGYLSPVLSDVTQTSRCVRAYSCIRPLCPLSPSALSESVGP